MLPVAQTQTASTASVFCSLIKVFVLHVVLLPPRNTSVIYHAGQEHVGKWSAKRRSEKTPRGREDGKVERQVRLPKWKKEKDGTRREAENTIVRNVPLTSQSPCWTLKTFYQEGTELYKLQWNVSNAEFKLGASYSWLRGRGENRICGRSEGSQRKGKEIILEIPECQGSMNYIQHHFIINFTEHSPHGCFPDYQQSFQKNINDRILRANTSSYAETIAANICDHLPYFNELNAHHNPLR